MDAELSRDPSVQNKLRAGQVLASARKWVIRLDPNIYATEVMWDRHQQTANIMDATRYDTQAKIKNALGYCHFPGGAQAVEVECIVVEVEAITKAELERRVARAELQRQIDDLQTRLKELE